MKLNILSCVSVRSRNAIVIVIGRYKLKNRTTVRPRLCPKCEGKTFALSELFWCSECDITFMAPMETIWDRKERI